MGIPISPETEDSIGPVQSYGLRGQSLSPIETLAQSISTIAPSTTPTMTVPLVFLLASNGTWLAYLLATLTALLVALCISRFARYSASPGSLYTYASFVRWTWAGPVAAWSLLLAYVATGASVVGGFVNYGNVLSRALSGRAFPPLAWAAVTVLPSTWIAYRDVKISARLMLWIEAVSICMIGVVVTMVLTKHGLRLDTAQLRLRDVSLPRVRLGLVLALFSFVGFESATTLGSEAREPLRTIPRAVIGSAVLAGAFFILCAYTEALAFHELGKDLGRSDSPLHVLATAAGVPVLGTLIDIGVLVSMFACTLGCITAAARVLMIMAHRGLVSSRMSKTHLLNATPAEAVIVTGVLVFLLVTILIVKGMSGADIYGWMGSLATYGFLVVYAQVAVALPFYLRSKQHPARSATFLSVATALVMLLAVAGSLYPAPDPPYNVLPYLYLGYLVCALLFFAKFRKKGIGRLES